LKRNAAEVSSLVGYTISVSRLTAIANKSDEPGAGPSAANDYPLS